MSNRITMAFELEDLKKIEEMCSEYQEKLSPDIDHVSYELRKFCIKAQAKLEG